MMSSGSLPQHIGIIMDGNGRWAKKRLKPRTFGHQEGLKTAKRIIAAARKMGIMHITLYAFSTENWKRAQKEVAFLINLVHSHLRKELEFYRENGIRIVHSGDIQALPEEIQHDLKSVIHDTKDFRGITVNLALNYGGRDEIIRACNRIATACPGRNFQDSPLTEQELHQHMDNPELPNPDLIIRSGGDIRLSNFLLWESAYSELYFTKTLWPDFSEKDLTAAVKEFQRRTRRFGGTNE